MRKHVKLLIVLILVLNLHMASISQAGFNPIPQKINRGPAKEVVKEEVIKDPEEEKPGILDIVPKETKLEPVEIGVSLINSPEYVAKSYSADLDPSKIGSTWEKKTINGKSCFVSPVIYAQKGVELNHHDVTIVYSGSGSLQAGMIYFTRRDIDKALDKSYNYSNLNEISSGKTKRFTYSMSGATHCWLVLCPAGKVNIQSIEHSCVAVPQGIYGHIPREYRFGGGSLPYRIMYPRNYDPSKKYPLVVSVHGSGGCGNDNRLSMERWNLARNLYVKYYYDENMECFSIVPQIPDIKKDAIPAPYYPSGASGKPNLSNRLRQLAAINEEGWYTQASISLIKDMIDSDELSIDSDRVYYTGFSFGGGACWEFLKAAPDLFAGAVSCAGWFVGVPYSAPTAQEMEQLKLDVARYKHIPTRVHVGGKDKMRFSSKPGYEEIIRQGGTSLYIEYPETDHLGSGDKTWDDANTVIWLFSQRKSTNISLSNSH